jgi:uncharacterized protein
MSAKKRFQDVLLRAKLLAMILNIMSGMWHPMTQCERYAYFQLFIQTNLYTNYMQNISLRFTLGGTLLGLGIAAGLIISSMQITRAWLHIADSQIITVTGAARQDVVSNQAIWSAVYSAEADSMQEAQQKLADYTKKVNAFFNQHGATNAEISAITIQRLKPQSNTIIGDDSAKKTIGYHLQQTIRLESEDVSAVVKLEQQSVELVNQGVELDDQGIQFNYTKSAEAKIEMLAEATKDARMRAEQIASQGGRKVRALKTAKMGVFQITPRNSNETSAEGLNDTTSKNKTIRAVVTASFTLDYEIFSWKIHCSSNP